MTPKEISDTLRVEAVAYLAAVRRIADQIEAMDTSAMDAPAQQGVPYRSQWEADAERFKSDCGPACAAMLIEWVTGQRVSIDQIAAECGMSEARPLTTPIDLTLGASRHAVRLETRLKASAQQIKPPAIVLVHYGSLPRLDMNYTAGHWVVVTRVDESGVTYHDPDWWEPRLAEGANRTALLDVFERAMSDCALDGNPAGLVLEVE